MSDHDDWMAKAVGVNVGALRGNHAAKPAAIDLYPKDVLQRNANKPSLAASPPGSSAGSPAGPSIAPPTAKPAAPPKPAPPPKDALPRAGDGRPFWRPAPSDATEKPEVSRPWLNDFMRFYRAGPPDPADPKGATCSFNGATMGVDAALAIVDAQATLNGFKPSRSTATGLLKELMQEGAESADLGDQLAKDAAGKGDLAADYKKLAGLPMPRLLAVLDRLKALKKLDDFTDRMPPGVGARVGVAIVTVEGRFEDSTWQSNLSKLNDEDQATVLMRAPAKVRKIAAGPAKAGEKDEDPVEVEAVLAGGKDGVDMVVKITAHSPLGTKLGETEGSVHIGADGKLTQLELNVTAFQATLTGKGSVAEVTVTVSGDATLDMAKDGSHLDKNALNAQVQAELAISLKRIKVLSGVTVKVGGSYGTGGPGATIGLEFKLPW